MARVRTSWKAVLLVLAMAAPPAESAAGCYGSYRLQQQLDLQMQFSDQRKFRRITVERIVHVRELGGSGMAMSRDQALFAVWSQEGEKSEPAVANLPPFLARVNRSSGRLLEIGLADETPERLEAALSLFDLFQYVGKPGRYRYRNANGEYTATLKRLKDGWLERVNAGYAETAGKIGTEVLQSQILLRSGSPGDCFFREARGEEVVRARLGKQTRVRTRSELELTLDRSVALARDHWFFALDGDIRRWPGSQPKAQLDPGQREQRLAALKQALLESAGDDRGFLRQLRSAQDLWPLLSELLSGQGLEDELSRRLFWALSRIDSPASVDALSRLVVMDLPQRDRYRALVALHTTRSKLLPEAEQRLQNHLRQLALDPDADSLDLAFVRMYGGLAGSRAEKHPLLAGRIRDGLYRELQNAPKERRPAFIDGIGNLGSGLDAVGEELLQQSLASGSPDMQLAVARAYGKLPASEAHQAALLDLLEERPAVAVQQAALSSLGRPESNPEVGRRLLSFALENANPVLRGKALGGLRKSGYRLQPGELESLSKRLAGETSLRNQRLMAEMILRERRGGEAGD